uniref:Surfeit locus protein 6 n=1 Tax=Sus scrofa TaxID=9823 RepID=A0A480ITD9_PIG
MWNPIPGSLRTAHLLPATEPGNYHLQLWPQELTFVLPHRVWDPQGSHQGHPAPAAMNRGGEGASEAPARGHSLVPQPTTVQSTPGSQEVAGAGIGRPLCAGGLSSPNKWGRGRVAAGPARGPSGQAGALQVLGQDAALPAGLLQAPLGLGRLLPAQVLPPPVLPLLHLLHHVRRALLPLALPLRPPLLLALQGLLQQALVVADLHALGLVQQVCPLHLGLELPGGARVLLPQLLQPRLPRPQALQQLPVVPARQRRQVPLQLLPLLPPALGLAGRRLLGHLHLVEEQRPRALRLRPGLLRGRRGGRHLLGRLGRLLLGSQLLALPLLAVPLLLPPASFLQSGGGQLLGATLPPGLLYLLVQALPQNVQGKERVRPSGQASRRGPTGTGGLPRLLGHRWLPGSRLLHRGLGLRFCSLGLSFLRLLLCFLLPLFWGSF